MPCAVPPDCRAFLEEQARLHVCSLNSVIVSTIRAAMAAEQQGENGAIHPHTTGHQ
jgi:hypothetical protein